MAKPKKAAQSKKNSKTHPAEESKLSHNGTDKKHSHGTNKKDGLKVQKTNDNVPEKNKQHQQKKSRSATGSNRSCLKCWLAIAFVSLGVAVSGIVFSEQLQEIVENTFQTYIQPQVPVVQKMFGWESESVPEVQDNVLKAEPTVGNTDNGDKNSNFKETNEHRAPIEDTKSSEQISNEEEANVHGDVSSVDIEVTETIENQEHPETYKRISPLEDNIKNLNVNKQPAVEGAINEAPKDIELNESNVAAGDSRKVENVGVSNKVNIDEANVENVELSRRETDVFNEKTLNVPEKETVFVSNKETVDVSNKEIVEVSKENVEVSDKNTVDETNKDNVDLSNKEAVDMSNKENVDVSNKKNVDVSDKETVVEPQKDGSTVSTKQDKNLEESEERAPEFQPAVADRATYDKSAVTNDEDLTIHKELDEADKLLEAENLEMALQKYDAILQKHTQSPRAHYGKGLTLDKLGFKYMSNENLERAIDFLAQVLHLKNVPDELQKLAGRKLADRQQFRGWGGQSVKTFKTLVERFPNDLDLRNELGVSYLMIGHNDRARDVYKQVLNKDPTNGFAKAHLGFIVKTQDNDLERAVELLSEGIKSGAPGTVDGRFFLHLGDSLLRLGRESEARKYFQEGEEKGLFLSAWQRSLYNVNRLTGRPWWTLEQTPYQEYLKLLRDNWKVIRDEGLANLNAKTGSFMPEEENLRDTGDWKQFTLYQQGRKKTENCAKAPETCKLIDQIPDARDCKRGQVKFSVMSPGIHVWPHVGPTNCRIRAHLGLVVPEGPIIRVMNETRTWKEGEFIIFDDSFEHEVWHEGSELRLVLIVDFWHPELTNIEKRRLSAI